MDQMVFNWAVAAAGALGGWILKVIWDAIVELKKDIQRMDTKMHKTSCVVMISKTRSAK